MLQTRTPNFLVHCWWAPLPIPCAYYTAPNRRIVRCKASSLRQDDPSFIHRFRSFRFELLSIYRFISFRTIWNHSHGYMSTLHNRQTPSIRTMLHFTGIFITTQQFVCISLHFNTEGDHSCGSPYMVHHFTTTIIWSGSHFTSKLK